jgi:hypothetical protein
MYIKYKTDEEILLESTFTPELDISNDKVAIDFDWLNNRKNAYQELNQDEMRYDDLINGTTTWQDAIQAVKDANPKPK